MTFQATAFELQVTPHGIPTPRLKTTDLNQPFFYMTLLLFMLHQLTSSSVPVITVTANRGCRITININIIIMSRHNKLLAHFCEEYDGHPNWVERHFNLPWPTQQSSCHWCLCSLMTKFMSYTFVMASWCILQNLVSYYMFIFVLPGPCVRLRSRQWWKLESLLGKTQRQKPQNWTTSWN